MPTRPLLHLKVLALLLKEQGGAATLGYILRRLMRPLLVIVSRRPVRTVKLSWLLPATAGFALLTCALASAGSGPVALSLRLAAGMVAV